MSKIKFSEGLFLEKQELNRWQKFLVDEGFKKQLLQNTEKFGIVRNSSIDPSFTMGLVQDGTNSETIKVNYTEAIDKNGNVVIQDSVDNIPVADDGNYYWVAIKHAFSDVEEGLVDVDANGSVTGVGTKFKEVLRGQPNFPAVISFTDANNNTLDYEVKEVLSDTNAILSGNFVSETNLHYRVVGTFTPGKVPSSEEKGPFQYDSSILSLYPETVLNTPPDFLVESMDFVLARVTIQGGQIVVEDKRSDFWKTKSEFSLEKLNTTSNNKIIGVESIKYDSDQSTRTGSVVFVAWGMRSTNWSINANINLLTIQSGNGGKFKSVSDFTTGDFDGWRVYLSKTGVLLNINTSVKSGSQINLSIENMDPELFSDLTQQIFIVPNTEDVEIKFTPKSGPDVNSRSYLFSAYTAEATCYVPSYGSSVEYEVEFRYRNHNSYTEWSLLPDDSVGYYRELAFDNNGLLTKPSERTPVINGTISVSKAEDSYSDFKSRIDLGDKKGYKVIDDLEILANTYAGRIIPLKVGTDKERLIIGESSKLISDIYIDLDRSESKSGNAFELQFLGSIEEEGYNVIFIQDGDTGNPIVSIGSDLRSGEQIFRFKFDKDENSWNAIYENNSFKGWNHFKPGPSPSVNTSSSIEVAPDGNNVLVVEGDSNFIKINDDDSVSDFAYIKFKNKKPINELYISRYGGSSNIDIVGNGNESYSENEANGDKNLYSFIGNEQQGTSGTIFNSLGGNEWLHLVLTKAGNLNGDRQGYMLLSSSNDRQTLNRGKSIVHREEFFAGGGNGVSTKLTHTVPDVDGNGGELNMYISATVNPIIKDFTNIFAVFYVAILKNGNQVGYARIYLQNQGGWHGNSLTATAAINANPGDTIEISTSVDVPNAPYSIDDGGSQFSYMAVVK